MSNTDVEKNTAKSSTRPIEWRLNELLYMQFSQRNRMFGHLPITNRNRIPIEQKTFLIIDSQQRQRLLASVGSQR